MRNRIHSSALAALLSAVIAAPGAAQPPTPAAPPGPERGAAGAQRDVSTLEKELAQARDDMQEAAREVARLSGELAAPVINDVTRQFRYAGQRAMLGLGIEDTDRGVRVASVSPNGPGAQAGLAVGDTIVAIEGAQLGSSRASGAKQSPSETLLAQMANVDPGEEVKLRVLNESGVERDVTVKARELSPRVWMNSPAFPFSFPNPGGAWFFANPWSQMQLVTLTPGLGAYFGTPKGLLVVRGPENAALLLRDGDVILDIGGREPTTPEHALRILGSFDQGEVLKITIMRNKSRQTLDLKMPTDAKG